MPRTAFKIWFLAILVSTAAIIVVSLVLRTQLDARVADPIAQAVGFTAMFALAWPWLQQRNRDPLRFSVFIMTVVSIAVIIATFRIKFLS